MDSVLWQWILASALLLLGVQMITCRGKRIHSTTKIQKGGGAGVDGVWRSYIVHSPGGTSLYRWKRKPRLPSTITQSGNRVLRTASRLRGTPYARILHTQLVKITVPKVAGHHGNDAWAQAITTFGYIRKLLLQEHLTHQYGE